MKNIFNLNRTILLLVIGISLLGCDKNNQPQPWSTRMAESVIKRNPEPWMIDFRETPKWEYTQGLVLKAILRVWESTGNQKYFDYVQAYYDQFVQDDGNIMLYKLSNYNIDRINPGKPLFALYKKTGDEKFRKAIFLLRKQMRTHPRVSEGGFWHKKIYPHQMWLDGVYMASPYLAQFAKTFDEPALFDDVANQILLMEKYARDKNSGLLYHGWDESHKQRWSNPETGQSQHFWGRGMGWYSMALVDALDFFPVDHPKQDDIIAVLKRLAAAIIKVQDRETGLWYQVLDQGGREGNYLEASASCMFTYSLIKGVRKGYLDESLLNNARIAYKGILNEFIEVDDTGLVHINKVCAVAGLGGDPYRDGSYEYYIGTEVRSNDPKAVGPFILASLELESLND